ncbi:MAG: hypothetical protein ACXVJG_22665, partial [Mucilaginibacter sp.]
MNYFKILAIFLLSLILFSCGKKTTEGVDDAAVLHENEAQLTNVIIYDIFTPPVASRIYGYTA